MKHVVIVGLGLIGGSLGMALRVRGIEVTGVDHAPVIGSREAQAATSQCVDVSDAPGVHRALRGAELVVLATPVSVIEAFVVEALEHAAVVTDCGSTKRGVARAAAGSPRAGHFVPGHPMTGRPAGGIENARPDLFAGQAWVVCGEGRDPKAVAMVEELVHSVEARPVALAVDQHDRAVAVTSHLPQLIASALLVLAHDRAAAEVAGPAFERVCRGAGGPEQIWLDIFASNATEVADATRALCDVLARVADGLDSGDAGAARELLARARRLH